MALPFLTPLELLEQAAPANPAAGSIRVYAFTDGTLHVLTPAGVDTALGAGGGGGGAAAVNDLTFQRMAFT